MLRGALPTPRPRCGIARQIVESSLGSGERRPCKRRSRFDSEASPYPPSGGLTLNEPMEIIHGIGTAI